MRKWILLGAVGLLLPLEACQRPPSAAERAELAEVVAQRQALEAQLDTLQVRLLDGRSRVSMARELAERHRHVSALACSNLDLHWKGITRFLDNQRDKVRRQRAARVAQNVARNEVVPGIIRAQ